LLEWDHRHSGASALLDEAAQAQAILDEHRYAIAR
jgi:hypothetical protein